VKEMTYEKKETSKWILSPKTKDNLRRYWFKYKKNKLSVVDLVIVIVSILLALFSKYIVPYPDDLGAVVNFAVAGEPPSIQHIFGTDVIGRDMFSRCLFAFGDAMLMAIIVLTICVPFGTFMGLLAGYNRGKALDTIIMRSTDMFLALPSTVLALVVAALLEPNMTNSMLAITVTWWPWYARLAYGQASTISNEYFIKNAELIGASKAHILFKEILPNCLSPIMTKMALDVGWVILAGATLSFVGLGAQPPMPAFGTMISEARQYLPDQWWLVVFRHYALHL